MALLTGVCPSGLVVGRGNSTGVRRASVASDRLLLPGDLLVEFLVDGDQRLAFHLVVEVAQVGGAVGVADDAVAGEPPASPDPQAAADQDQGDQLAAGLSQRLRLAGFSSWAMTCAASARGSRWPCLG